ncbi:hypothetical protein Tco_1352947 [Tanacetum coccineum]
MIYEDIRPIFERVWDQNQSFVTKDSEIEKEVMKRSGFDFQKLPAKRQKIGKVSESVEETIAGKKKRKSRRRAKETVSDSSSRRRGVHHVSTERGHDIFMLVEKDYPLTRALMIVMLANKLQVDESSEMENELLRKIFYQVERPRT